MALQSEVDILSQLDHPNVVRLFEIFDEGDMLYLVLELMIGGEVSRDIINFYSYSIELSRKNIIQRKKLLTRLGLWLMP
jgi:serine/threonine protein kinase